MMCKLEKICYRSQANEDSWYSDKITLRQNDEYSEGSVERENLWLHMGVGESNELFISKTIFGDFFFLMMGRL